MIYCTVQEKDKIIILNTFDFVDFSVVVAIVVSMGGRWSVVDRVCTGVRSVAGGCVGLNDGTALYYICACNWINCVESDRHTHDTLRAIEVLEEELLPE